MLSNNISFKNFNIKNKDNKIKKRLFLILKEKNQSIESLKKEYKYTFNKNKIEKFKKSGNFRLIGMGGSILGAQAIYDFLNFKIKKNFTFINNLKPKIKKNSSKKTTNIVVSKSGNTIETILNANILIKKKDENIFITENKKNYLYILAQKLKAEIIHHNNFIGGRYSVLSEVGMLPAELMGLKINKFKQLNSLIKNKKFLNALISNVSSTLYFINQKKFNSIIINYDEKSESLFQWYQQLIAESLGKKNKGLLPMISSMPKDNHSLMQLYLDGNKNCFFTFFDVFEKNSPKILEHKIFDNFKYLKKHNLQSIKLAQKEATKNVFKAKKIPFRSFEVMKKNEETLGELFTFFMLETILLGKLMNVNPFDQPAVELIKKETKKLLV